MPVVTRSMSRRVGSREVQLFAIEKNRGRGACQQCGREFSFRQSPVVFCHPKCHDGKIYCSQSCRSLDVEHAEDCISFEICMDGWKMKSTQDISSSQTIVSLDALITLPRIPNEGEVGSEVNTARDKVKGRILACLGCHSPMLMNVRLELMDAPESRKRKRNDDQQTWALVPSTTEIEMPVLKLYNKNISVKTTDYLCTKCGWPVCNKNCEKAENHRLECSSLAKLNRIAKKTGRVPIDEDFVNAYISHAIHRVYMLKTQNVNVYQNFMELKKLECPNEDDRKYLDYEINRCMNYLYPIKIKTTEASDILCRILAYRVNFWELCTHRCDYAVYPLKLFVNCLPNTQFTLENTKLTLKPVGNIPKGTILTIGRYQWSLTPPFTLPIKSRREKPREDESFFYLPCECQTCNITNDKQISNDLYRRRCNINKCRGFLHPSDETSPLGWKCDVCFSRLSPTQVNNLEATEMISLLKTGTISSGQMDQTKSLDNLSNWILAHKNEVPEYQIAFAQLRRIQILYSCRQPGSISEMKNVRKYISEYTKVVKKYYPGENVYLKNVFAARKNMIMKRS